MADYEQYFDHLNSISRLGFIYKRYFAARVLYQQALHFGDHFAEIGCGTGNGILGAYPKQVVGFEINPFAVDYCKAKHFDVRLIDENANYPAQDGEFSACILDNVLEHIADPTFVLQECKRITPDYGGLIIVVPGDKGYACDPDHKKHYKAAELAQLSQDWQLLKMFSLPFLVKSECLSKAVSQYCLVAVYKKRV